MSSEDNDNDPDREDAANDTDQFEYGNEEAPTEPRDTEGGQQQASDPESGEIDAGAEPEDRSGDLATDSEDTEGEPDDQGSTTTANQRSTAPQSAFTNRQVGIGFAVLVVGLVIAFAIPLALG
jgi:hypothetical protein